MTNPIVCFAIERTDCPGCYWSHAYSWDGGLHRALFYKTTKAAIEMAERKGKPYKIVTVYLEKEEDDG